MKIEEAIKKVEEHLAEAETIMNNFGSALPGYVNPNIKLKILNDITKEYNFGWVFYYNTTKFIETGALEGTLIGNAPLIINKVTGELIKTGTEHPPSTYINNYIKTGDPFNES